MRGKRSTFFSIPTLQARLTDTHSYVFAQWQIWVTPIIIQVPVSYTLPTNLAIVLFAFVYEIGFVLDAIRLRNSIQIVAACLHNVCIMIFTAVQHQTIHKAILGLPSSRDAAGEPLVNLDVDWWSIVGWVLLAVPIIIGVASVLLCLIAFRVKQEYSWMTYKQLKGDLLMKRRLLAYQVYVVLLKYDFFVITAFLVVYSVTVLEVEGWESIVNLVMIGVTAVVLIFAGFWTKREVMSGMVLTIVSTSASLTPNTYDHQGADNFKCLLHRRSCLLRLQIGHHLHSHDERLHVPILNLRAHHVRNSLDCFPDLHHRQRHPLRL